LPNRSREDEGDKNDCKDIALAEIRIE